MHRNKDDKDIKKVIGQGLIHISQVHHTKYHQFIYKYILIDIGIVINYYVHFVEKTSFWNFPDDIVIQISGNDEGCVIEIHSESRLGWGDVGINPERINKIHELLV